MQARVKAYRSLMLFASVMGGKNCWNSCRAWFLSARASASIFMAPCARDRLCTCIRPNRVLVQHEAHARWIALRRCETPPKVCVLHVVGRVSMGGECCISFFIDLQRWLCLYPCGTSCAGCPARLRPCGTILWGCQLCTDGR